MKKGTLKYAKALVALTMVGSAMLCSCSKIDENERLIYVEPAAVNRAVLIEDFTGQKCVNCPNAATAIHEMQEVYGEDKVIAVAIHSGPFGLASGLMTELGTTYWNQWFSDTQGQPVVKINRGEGNDNISSWAGIVATELTKQTDVELVLVTDWKKDTRELTIDVSALGKVGVNEKLQLWLVEDGIVAAQKLPDGTTDKKYVHNHVLREAINGDWGESITYGESAVSKQYTITLSDKYDAENCSVVAFTYGDNGVSQAKIKAIN